MSSALPSAFPGAPGAQLAPLEVLVVGADRQLLEVHLLQQGHRIRSARDAQQALRLFDPASVDLVLMDVVLPGTDGVETAKLLRARSRERWVPLILLSSPHQEQDVLRGLEAGADDYIVEPVSFAVLGAKIRSFQRIAAMNRTLAESARTLAGYREEAEAELELATALIGEMMHQEGLRDSALTWSVTPSHRFSGDAVAALRAPSGRLVAMLADATGHGLAAAISLLPGLQAFYATVRADLSIGEIAREINRRLGEGGRTGRYVAAVLVEMEPGGRRIQVWNGGIPDGLWIRRGTQVRSDGLRSRHLPLGVLPDEQFDATACAVDTGGDGHVVFFSDGLIEAAGPSGEPFGMQRLSEHMLGAPMPEGLHRALDALHAHLAGAGTRDDISLLMIALG